ncbi:hypothetical protein LguiB_010980 [Lonicera macranthoides]
MVPHDFMRIDDAHEFFLVLVKMERDDVIGSLISFSLIVAHLNVEIRLIPV